MRKNSGCEGCHLYPNLCIIVPYLKTLRCPCVECLVKVTCVTQPQSCLEYQIILDVVHQKLEKKFREPYEKNGLV
jgi:hypothetical protein